MADNFGNWASTIRISRSYHGGADARLVEAMMRDSRGSLERLSWSDFDHAVADAIADIEHYGAAFVEEIAKEWESNAARSLNRSED